MKNDEITAGGKENLASAGCREKQQLLRDIRRDMSAGRSFGEAQTNSLIYTSQLAALKTSVANVIFGAGETLTPLLEDPAVTDVLVNGTAGVWVDRGSGLTRLPDSQIEPELQTEPGIRALAVRLAATCGQRLDDAAPIVDGTFPSGVRLHAVLPPLSAEGPLISLRTHRRKSLSLPQLIANGSIHPQFAQILQAFITKKANVIISGATGAGKTTFLSAMLQLVPHTERILVIEESAELRPPHPHVIHLQERRANVQGIGKISMSELVRAAMRMRPDRIVLGECRGAEVRDVLSALNTGHDGGWATIHANSAADVPARLVALGALAGMQESAVAAQAASALDAVVHIRRSGSLRYVSEIGVLQRVGSELQCHLAWQISLGKSGSTELSNAKITEFPAAKQLRENFTR
ncbi:TadA family conjugal transfer-associated ATPase [Arcanobacterium hippocoleae]|uniref:TadA family conjugal transfer-associated ATPase n=1 Tax=Arcanobacterium hippocoleae TaxID=149017 RepID=UPI00334094A8